MLDFERDDRRQPTTRYEVTGRTALWMAELREDQPNDYLEMLSRQWNSIPPVPQREIESTFPDCNGDVKALGALWAEYLLLEMGVFIDESEREIEDIEKGLEQIWKDTQSIDAELATFMPTT